jgi:hypothetical protein
MCDWPGMPVSHAADNDDFGDPLYGSEKGRQELGRE